MALPAESRGRNTPETCLTRIAAALSPANRWIFATSAVETVRSAVTTTRCDEVFTYQAMPSTCDRWTAWLIPASWLELRCRALAAPWVWAAGAADEKATAVVATRPRVAASKPATLTDCRRCWTRLAVIDPPNVKGPGPKPRSRWRGTGARAVAVP